MILWKTATNVSFPIMTECLLDYLLLLSAACHSEGKELFIEECNQFYFLVRTRDWTPNQVNRVATKYKSTVELDSNFRWIKFNYDSTSE